MAFAITRRRTMAPIVLTAAAALALTACSGGTGGESPGASDVDCSPYEVYGTFDNSPVVAVGSTIVGVEADQMLESWADFETCTGITIDFQGSQEFETQITVQAAGGNPPDLAIFPQPGLLQTVVATGAIVPAPQSVEDNVDQWWSEDWKNYGTIDDTFYAAPLMASVKGYIWYSPSDLADAGIEVPTTWDEMIAATDALITAHADEAGYKPWCAGFGSGDATGWPGTDWIEDVVLRELGPDQYDAWIAGDLAFSSPEIQQAFNDVGSILKNEDYVNGGIGNVQSINSTTFNDGGLPILQGTCSFHHQASFYEAQWPAGTTVAEDGDVYAFLMPGESADSQSVTGGGEFVGAFNDDPATVAVQTFLSSDTWANNRVSIGGVISANKGLDPANAASDIGRQSVEILQNPDTVFRFDGSDLMPSAVGANSFWKGMVNWINGDSTETVTSFIDSTWP